MSKYSEPLHNVAKRTLLEGKITEWLEEVDKVVAKSVKAVEVKIENEWADDGTYPNECNCTCGMSNIRGHYHKEGCPCNIKGE